jgi:putative flippase GtrA
MRDREFQAAWSIFDDNRKLIAAGKSQRSEAVKWAVTVNVAIAGAAIALRQQYQGNIFLVSTILAAVLGAVFVYEINRRMTRIRRDDIVVEAYLRRNGINFSAITGHAPIKSISPLHDWQELVILGGILFLSVMPMLFVWCVLKGHEPLCKVFFA